ncbi:MAG: succinic semialdehyde dehydrogenase [Actinomycetales bacterium]|nr:MAG: succinic semialdehyde dehydrogenase [Actinomycetales bacterium]
MTTRQHTSGKKRPSDPLDPEHDLGATYALDQSFVRHLTRRLVASSGESTMIHAPATGQPLGSIPKSTPEDVHLAFARSREVARTWAETSYGERSKMLMKLHDMILDRREEIMDLICWESGKARIHAFDEPLHVALTARYYARTLKKHLEPRRRDGVVPLLTRVEEHRSPKGVVAIISPWNYPFTMALVDGIAALAAGNGVVSKPDHHTPFSALLGLELLEEAGLPPGLWQMVAGEGRKLGGPMIEEADYLCFTGSTATGKHVAKQCAEQLIGCSLELGGKNPIIVLADADVERAAEGAVRAAFSNGGQLCVSTERLYVAAEIYDDFVAKFVDLTKAMRLGPSHDWGIDMGSLISAEQLKVVADHVDDAVAHGATVLAGGKARPDIGPYFYEPTILEGVTSAMACHGDETFGPVISVYPVHSEDEAVELANAGDYGLNAAVYSRNTAHARSVANRIKCGTVNINEGFSATFASIDAPMGGMRSSGMGRRQGAEGILRYTEVQAVATQYFLRFGPHWGLSDETYANVMTMAVKLLGHLGRA